MSESYCKPKKQNAVSSPAGDESTLSVFRTTRQRFKRFRTTKRDGAKRDGAISYVYGMVAAGDVGGKELKLALVNQRLISGTFGNSAAVEVCEMY